MKLVPLLAAKGALLSLRSPDVCDQLQIFLHETELQEIRLSTVQCAVSSVFIMDDSYL